MPQYFGFAVEHELVADRPRLEHVRAGSDRMLRAERARRMEDAARVDRTGVRLVLLERRRARHAEVRQRERADERRRRPASGGSSPCVLPFALQPL